MTIQPCKVTYFSQISKQFALYIIIFCLFAKFLQQTKDGIVVGCLHFVLYHAFKRLPIVAAHDVVDAYVESVAVIAYAGAVSAGNIAVG